MKIQIALSASGLKNVGARRGPFKRVSSPFAVVLLHPPAGGPADILGKTETVKQCLNPNWHTQFLIDHDERHKKTYINIFIFDRDTEDKTREFISITQTEGFKIMDYIEIVNIGEVIGKTKPYVVKMDKGGILKIFAEEQKEEMKRGYFSMQLRGLRLKNIEKAGMLKGLIDPYYEVWKLEAFDPNEEWSLVYRSEYVMDHINPMWDPCKMDIAVLCNADFDRELEIRVYDWEKFANDRLIGSARTTVNKLRASKSQKGNGDLSKAFHITLEQKGENFEEKERQSMGALVVLEASLDETATSS